MKTRRRFLVPEVVQSSSMDCGPAALACMLQGFGVQASYGRLREACQTDVDGTSIDTLEDVAVRLGLEAEQVIVPLDFVFHPKSRVLPALIVVQLPGGMMHFTVMWRLHGPLLQVMDPAIGRRWLTRKHFLESVYVHTARVPASAWREWAASDAMLAIVEARLRSAGIDPQPWIQAARDDPGWRGLAALDAACRALAALQGAGALRKGREATRALQRLIAEPASIDLQYWSVQPAGDDELAMQGAVFIHVRGVREAPADRRALGPELNAALAEKPPHPARELWRLLREGGWLSPGVAAAGLALAAAGVILEAVLLRSLVDVGRDLPLAGQRMAAMAAVVGFLLLLLLLDMRLARLIAGLGRQLEIRLRLAFLQKIPRLGDRYFHSRLKSDMAERSHTTHRIRGVPDLAARLGRSSCELIFTVGAITWVDPSVAPFAIGAALCAVGLPLLMQPVIAERDLRVKTHSGALCRFYLDALLGLSPIRTHGGERAVRREHARLLGEWARAGLVLQRTAVRVEALQLTTVFGFTALAILGYAAGTSEPGSLLLLVYWLLNLPLLGEDIALVAWQYPSYRSTTLRVLEPLGALEHRTAARTTPDGRERQAVGAAIVFDGVTVRVAGHPVLHDVDLAIPAGSHVAIVGASGAGKSSLVGVLLGWHQPADGTVLVDARRLADCLDELRRQTAWVDPSVQLWNEPLTDNLLYGLTSEGVGRIDSAIQAAGLWSVIQKLPDGMRTELGEGGALVSGGEGQRVRLARALGKASARLVILDEPFRGVDHAERRRLLDEARRLWPRATLLYITHDISHTTNFDRVIVVEAGRVVEDGRPQSLAVSPDSRYRALLEAERTAYEQLWCEGRWQRARLDGGELRVVQENARLFV
jgi:ATP-binding cassette subfamily B protein